MPLSIREETTAAVNALRFNLKHLYRLRAARIDCHPPHSVVIGATYKNLVLHQPEKFTGTRIAYFVIRGFHALVYRKTTDAWTAK